jgi:hypothetical protein
LITDYPKSREELLAENAELLSKVAGLEAFSRSQEQIIIAKEREVEVLRRRKPPHVLDPKATDSFRRPYRG